MSDATNAVRAPNLLVDALGLPARNSMIWRLATVIAASLLLTLSAKIEVPFYPVPLSLQTFAVLGLGFVLGSRLAGSAVLLYLIEGAAGLPVFAGTPEKGIGLAYLMGPTGGYLVGFLFAAVLCGLLAERGWGKSVISTLSGMVMGNIVIYALGLFWLGTLLGWDKPILHWGLYPFLLGDALKIALATALLPAAWKFAARR
ncbi:MAG TPA: biotin transporter BioY [Rhizobiaceae bacterium]|nr:biotin transporter BioY [Rhizobiaceae bacterium]